MPSELKSGVWRDLSNDSWTDVTYKDSIMDPMKAVCIVAVGWALSGKQY